MEDCSLWCIEFTRLYVRYSLFSCMSTHASLIPSQRSSVESYIPPSDTLTFTCDHACSTGLKYGEFGGAGIPWYGVRFYWNDSLTT